MLVSKAGTYLREEPSQAELPKSKGRLLWPCSQAYKSIQNFFGDKHYSLFVQNVSDEEKSCKTMLAGMEYVFLMRKVIWKRLNLNHKCMEDKVQMLKTFYGSN